MSGPTGRLGFLADTHSRKADGSDRPDGVVQAFQGMDLIVHLGDVGHRGILSRLSEVAPVLVPVGANKGYVPFGGGGEVTKVLQIGETTIGLWFNLTQPDRKIEVGEASIDFGSEPFERLMKRRFGRPVNVVAFAGTHRPLEQHHQGVLFFNPGSPTLPMAGCPLSVAVLDVAGPSSSVEILSLH